MGNLQIDMLKGSIFSSTQFPQASVMSELKMSNPNTENTTRLELAPTHQLPAHLIWLLEEWHRKNPNERPPIASTGPNPAEVEETYIIPSLHRNGHPLLKYINIVQPLCYWVLYLRDDDGKQNEGLMRPSDWESGVCFLEKWLGGHQFQALPVAVRLASILNSFEYFPEDVTWQRASVVSLPIEMGGREEERINRFSVSRKRLRTEGGTSNRSYGESQPQIQETHSSRPSTPYSSYRQATPTSHLVLNTPSIATGELGIDNQDAISYPHIDPIINSSPLPSSITFQLRIPRMKMERHIRVEDNEQTADELLKEAARFFRRYERLIGMPILECVTEGEPDCRCIYNAMEMIYYIEELRERQGVIKVTVTLSARSSTG